MYTSDKSALKNCIGHICVSRFLALFGAIYERYSHEVYSYYMIYAFAIPLLFGALPFGIAALKNAVPRFTGICKKEEMEQAVYNLLGIE